MLVLPLSVLILASTMNHHRERRHIAELLTSYILCEFIKIYNDDCENK